MHFLSVTPAANLPFQERQGFTLAIQAQSFYQLAAWDGFFPHPRLPIMLPEIDLFLSGKDRRPHQLHLIPAKERRILHRRIRNRSRPQKLLHFSRRIESNQHPSRLLPD